MSKSGFSWNDIKSIFSLIIEQKFRDTSSRPIMIEEVSKILMKLSGLNEAREIVLFKETNNFDEINNFFMNNYWNKIGIFVMVASHLALAARCRHEGISFVDESGHGKRLWIGEESAGGARGRKRAQEPREEEKRAQEAQEEESRAQKAQEEESRAQKAREEEKRAQEAREEESRAQEAQEEERRAQEAREEQRRVQETPELRGSEREVSAQEEQVEQEREVEAQRGHESEVKAQEGHEGEVKAQGGGNKKMRIQCTRSATCRTDT